MKAPQGHSVLKSPAVLFRMGFPTLYFISTMNQQFLRGLLLQATNATVFRILLIK